MWNNIFYRGYIHDVVFSEMRGIITIIRYVMSRQNMER